MLTRLPGQILVASHNEQHWSGLKFEDICSKDMILLFGDNFCTFSNVKMSIVSKRYLWLRMFVQRYLVWDIKHLIEEAACEINVDMGMDCPVECPLIPLLNAPSSPLGCAPLLAVTKTAQFYANPTTTPWYKSPALSAICKYIYSYSIILSPRLLDQRPKTFNFIVTPFKSWCGGLTINLLAYTTWFWKPIDHW